MRSMIRSASRTARTCGLTPASRSVTPSAFISSWISVSFAAPWESMKLTPSRSSTSARWSVRPGRARGRAPRVPLRLRRTARRPCAGRRCRERLVGGVLVEIAEDLGPGLPAQQRHRRPRRDIDEPAEREDDPDHHARKDARREHADDRRHRDPEVESRDPIETAQLANVDHAEHDRVDDHRPEHGLREVREQRREEQQGREHQAPGHQRRDLRARARGLVQRAGREAGRHRHPLKHAHADVRHPLSDRLLIHVDPVAVPRSERPSVACGLGEPDQQQRDRRDDNCRVVVPTRPRSGSSGRAARLARRRRAPPRARRDRTAMRPAARPPRAPAHPEPQAPSDAVRGSPRAP